MAKEVIIENRPVNPPLPLPRELVTEFQYAVKVICGDSNNRPYSSIAVPGQYLTAINVHNPSLRRKISIRYKLAIALPGAKAGPVSTFHRAELGPDEAFEIDCPDIQKLAAEDLPFIKGFVVLESPIEIDVVAVYSAGHHGTTQVETLHTERVPGRPFNPCGNLNLLVATGRSRWTVIQAPTGVPTGTPAVPVAKPASSWINIPGATWVQAPQSGQTAGLYVYEYCFCLCSGFEHASLSMLIRTDNGSTVLLNGNQIGSTSATSFSQNTPTTISTSNQAFFKAGDNCIHVQVTNDGGPHGFTLTLQVKASRGNCQTKLFTNEFIPDFDLSDTGGSA